MALTTYTRGLLNSLLHPLRQRELRPCRAALSKSITLIESSDKPRRAQAKLLLDSLAEESQPINTSGDRNCNYFRIGISGPPGAGKSTLIETLVSYVLDNSTIVDNEKVKAPDLNCGGEGSVAGEDNFSEENVAVICVDPSSHRSGGSILGDKTRMESLSRNPRVFVRPSPTRLTLGGLGSYTNDVVGLCCTAGYPICIVETVGVGQSEIAVDQVVDMLILVVPPGGGDELQGVKKGIVEVADLVIVNKADGGFLEQAKRTRGDYYSGMMYQMSKHGDKAGGGAGGGKGSKRNKRKKGKANDVDEGGDDDVTEDDEPTMASWHPPVLLCSGSTGAGIPQLWSTINEYRQLLTSSGYISSMRSKQDKYWVNQLFEEGLRERARGEGDMEEKWNRVMTDIENGSITPRAGAEILLDGVFGGKEEGTTVGGK